MYLANTIIAFNLGLFSTLHCLGMCGGISTAMSLSIPQEKTVSKTLLVIAYNTGRIMSYTLAGAIAGAIGTELVMGIMPVSGHRILQYIAAAVLILIGLQISGWLPAGRILESVGMRIWSYIRPLSKYFLPITSLYRAFMAGIFWGWLPCALVYSVLVWSLSIGGALSGALLMFCFGLGTLPGMLLVGLTGTKIRDFLKEPALRTVAGVVIILFGASSPFLYSAAENHHEHHHTSADKLF